MIKRIAFVCSIFYPDTSSAANQLRDLSFEFLKKGYEVTVFVPSSDINDFFYEETYRGVIIVRLQSLKSRDTNYFRRGFAELYTGYSMIKNIKRSSKNKVNWDGIVWYSPSIFLTPFVKYIKKNSDCNVYLIVRDIFPKWMIDLKIMKKRISYYILKYFELSQYRLANTVGIQSPSDLNYFLNLKNRFKFNLEVLDNWLSINDKKKSFVSKRIQSFSDKIKIIYAGNMGVAQELDLFLELCDRLKNKNLLFIFIGRGSEKRRLQKKATFLNLKNIIFFDEVDSAEILELYNLCDIGIVSLNRYHKTNNIPGKFISYISAGLPVFALLNKNNNLIDLIKNYKVGISTSLYTLDNIEKLFLNLVNQVKKYNYYDNCKKMYLTFYTTKKAVLQIERAIL